VSATCDICGGKGTLANGNYLCPFCDAWKKIPQDARTPGLLPEIQIRLDALERRIDALEAQLHQRLWAADDRR
jgi:hypothetical protein